MKKKSKVTILDFLSGTIETRCIEMNQNTSFSVTFEETGAENQGHHNWLRKQFEGDWKRKVEKDGFIVKSISTGNGKKGNSVTIGMEIEGIFHPGLHGNSSFIAFMSAQIRKFLAENIIKLHYRPDFDLQKPLFDAFHIHRCLFSLGISITDNKFEEKIAEVFKNSSNLSDIIESCGAKSLNPFFEKIKGGMIGTLCQPTKYAIPIRWKTDASKERRETLEKVVSAFFLGKGLYVNNWEIESIGEDLPETEGSEKIGNVEDRCEYNSFHWFTS